MAILGPALIILILLFGVYALPSLSITSCASVFFLLSTAAMPGLVYNNLIFLDMSLRVDLGDSTQWYNGMEVNQRAFTLQIYVPPA